MLKTNESSKKVSYQDFILWEEYSFQLHENLIEWRLLNLNHHQNEHITFTGDQSQTLLQNSLPHNEESTRCIHKINSFSFRCVKL